MTTEQTALLNVAVRLNAPALKSQQQVVRTNLRKQARERRTEILSRRKLAIQSYKEAMDAFKAELEQVTPTLKQAVIDSNLKLEQEATERLTNIAESGRLGMTIAAQDTIRKE